MKTLSRILQTLSAFESSGAKAEIISESVDVKIIKSNKKLKYLNICSVQLLQCESFCSVCVSGC